MTDDPRAWTVFDPNLLIETHPIEGGNIVVITHLPTMMQEASGATTSVALNQATAMTRLRHRVEGFIPGEIVSAAALSYTLPFVLGSSNPKD